MRKYNYKIISSILIGLLLNLSFLQTTALAESKEAKTAKVKAGIIKLGVGKESKVKVKLFDRTEISGYISEANEGAFTVINEKSNFATEVPYSQVKQVKGNNMSNGVKVAIGLGILLAIVVVIALAGEGF
jgi:hypothetical protein